MERILAVHCYMVSFTWGRAQFTPAFVAGFMESLGRSDASRCL